MITTFPSVNTKHKAQSLASVHARLQPAVFDPENATHLQAFEMLINGRQHPTLRFQLDLPYVNVRQMMYDKVGRAYLAKFSNAA